MESRSFGKCVSIYDDVLQCMCLVRCVWIDTLGVRIFSRGFYCYDGSFAREWINTILNIPALISLASFQFIGAK
jgi:hypothetical protein